MFNRAPVVGARYLGYGPLAADPATPVRAATAVARVSVAASASSAQRNCATFAAGAGAAAVGSAAQLSATTFSAGAAGAAAAPPASLVSTTFTGAAAAAAGMATANVASAAAVGVAMAGVRSVGAQFNTSNFAAAPAAAATGDGPGQAHVDAALFGSAVGVAELPVTTWKVEVPR